MLPPRGRLRHDHLPSPAWPGHRSSNSPLFAPERNARHSERVNSSLGPSGFFESRTATPSGRAATSTQSPLRLWVLLRHTRRSDASDMLTPFTALGPTLPQGDGDD